MGYYRTFVNTKLKNYSYSNQNVKEDENQGMSFSNVYQYVDVYIRHLSMHEFNIAAPCNLLRMKKFFIAILISIY